MRIAFLGDSLTWGGYGGSFIATVRALLNEHSIINAGQSGDTVLNLQRRLPALLERHAPQAVFVMVGGNDAASYTMPATRSYYRASKKNDGGIVSPARFARSHRELLLQLQGQRIRTFVGLAPNEYSPTLQAAQRQYNALAEQNATALHIPVLDLQPAFPAAAPQRAALDLRFIQNIGARIAAGWRDYESEREKYGYSYTFDGLHLTPAAAQKMGRLISSFLQQHLA